MLSRGINYKTYIVVIRFQVYLRELLQIELIIMLSIKVLIIIIYVISANISKFLTNESIINYIMTFLTFLY